MTTRTKWLAAALLVAAAMTTTIGTIVFTDATGQQPGGLGGPGFPGGGGGRSGARGGGGTTASGMAAMLGPPKWEYKVTRLPVMGEDGIEKELNKLGDDAWELVTTVEKNGSVVVVLKRQKGRAFPGAATGGGFGGVTTGTGFGGPVPAEGSTDTVPAGSDVSPATTKTSAAKDSGAHVLPLKHAKAAELQETLSPLLNAESYPVRGGATNGFGAMSGFIGGSGGQRISVGNKVKIVADSRTNSLIVITDDATLKTIKELLEKLDVPEKAEKSNKANTPTQTN